MVRAPPAPDLLHIQLAHKLGFPRYPSDITSEPYLNYLTNRCIGSNSIDGHTQLLLRVITYFGVGNLGQDPVGPKRSIQGLIDALITDPAYTGCNEAEVEDIVLYTLGSWMMLLSFFVLLPLAGGVRRVTLVYRLQARGKLSTYGICQPYEEDVARLIVDSGLPPAPTQYSCLDEMVLDDTSHDLDALETLSISATRLNAYTLKVLGAVDIALTYNVSRHLLLSKRAGKHILEVFALPCALSANFTRSATTGTSADLAQEIRELYSLLFNAWAVAPQHAKLGVG